MRSQLCTGSASTLDISELDCGLYVRYVSGFLGLVPWLFDVLEVCSERLCLCLCLSLSCRLQSCAMPPIMCHAIARYGVAVSLSCPHGGYKLFLALTPGLASCGSALASLKLITSIGIDALGDWPPHGDT